MSIRFHDPKQPTLSALLGCIGEDSDRVSSAQAAAQPERGPAGARAAPDAQPVVQQEAPRQNGEGRLHQQAVQSAQMYAHLLLLLMFNQFCTLYST